MSSNLTLSAKLNKTANRSFFVTLADNLVKMLYLISIFVLSLLLATFAYAGVLTAPWVPTQKKNINRSIKLAKIKPGHLFYDIGCGDGRVVIAAARSGAVARGLEVSLLPYIIAKMSSLILLKRLRFKIYYKNLWKANLSDADIVYIWLAPKIMTKLGQKLKNELRPGTLVVACVWPIEEWIPKHVDKKPGQVDIYLYEM